MIILYILAFYILGGILVTGIITGTDDSVEGEDAVTAFFFWPICLIILCVMGVSKITKAMINESKNSRKE